ncbi:MAG: hypothetical protein ACXVXI_10545, partial [Mycobacteriaceae bacterium]
HRQRHRFQGNHEDEDCVLKVAPHLPECSKSAPMPGGTPAPGIWQPVGLADTDGDHTVWRARLNYVRA